MAVSPVQVAGGLKAHLWLTPGRSPSRLVESETLIDLLRMVESALIMRNTCSAYSTAIDTQFAVDRLRP